MKALFIILLFSLFAFTLNTCTTSKNDAQFSEVTINGIIDNFENYAEEFAVVNVYVNHIVKSLEKHSSYIKKDGSFLVQFSVTNPQDVTLTYGNKGIMLFVEPNDSLHLKIDAVQLLEGGVDNNSVSISGTSVEVNEILIDYRPRFSTFLHETYINDFEPGTLAKDLSANEYKSYIYERMNKNMAYLNNYISQNNISNKLFEKWARLEIEFRCLEYMIDYKKYHARYNEISSKDVKLPEDYYDFLQKYSPNDADNLMCSTFHLYLSRYISITYYDFLAQNNLSYGDSSFTNYLKATLKQEDNLVRDVKLSQIFYHSMDRNFKLIEPFYETYLATVHNEALKDVVIDRYNILFVYENSANKPNSANLNIILDQDSLLSTILETHKNKVIYIDFWATWCSPCKAEFPNSQKLYQRFSKKEVSFVYLCNRSTKESWQNMISKHNILGDHYLLTNKQFEILSSFFQIAGIPHYVLINKNGEIVDKNAKRPSNPEIISEINMLL